jgi:hypothetical protein
MATLDFKNKQVKFSEPYYTTDDKEKDFEYFKSFFSSDMAKKTNQFI